MQKELAVLLLTVLLLAGCQPHAQRQQLAETRLQLGLALMARHRLDDAQRNLAEAQRLAPDDYRVMLAQARYQQLAGNTSQAGTRYRKLLKIAADNGYVLNNYGAFLCGLGQYEAAQQQFQAAAQTPQPGAKADSDDNAGYCYLRAGRLDMARQALVQAIKADAQKGAPMLAEASHRYAQGDRAQARLLLDIYQQFAPATAESLWLEIRFAALAGRRDDVQRYAAQLAQNFSHSLQYQQFLANEY